MDAKPEVVAIPERNFVALVFANPPKNRLRFLFVYQGRLHAICWMAIGSDGSLYLNPRTTSGEPMRHGVAIADGAGGFSESEWSDAEPAPADYENPKVSYHASGRTKGGARMSTSIRLREITGPTLVRQDDYQHPSRFEVITEDDLRATDIVVPGQGRAPYELQEDAPLTSRVFVAPLVGGNAQVTLIDDDPNAREGQTAIVVPATGLKDCQDLTYQVQFFNRRGAEWPDTSTIAVVDA
jgi:hypothetical protein